MTGIVDHEGKPLSAFHEALADKMPRKYKGARSLDSRTSTPWQQMYKPEDETFLRDRKALNARSMEAYRNDGLIKGAVDDKVRLIFGNRWSMCPTLDRDFLELTEVQEKKLFSQLDRFNAEVADRRKFIHSAGKMNFHQLMMLAKRLEIVKGESFLKVNRFKARNAPFNFNIQVIDEGRVDTPSNLMADPRVKAGIKSTGLGYAQAAYIHKYHTNASRCNRGPNNWVTTPFKTALGGIQLIHTFNSVFEDQMRGLTQLAPMLLSSQKKDKMIDYSMEDFIAKAQIALVIRSDKSDIAEAFGIGKDQAEEIKKKTMANVNGYMENSTAWHEDMGIEYANEQLLRLYDGEQLDGFSPESSAGSLAEFMNELNSNDARSMGLSREHFTQRWNDIAYSGTRAGALTVKRTVEDETIGAIDNSQSVYDVWVEDKILSGKLLFPNHPSALKSFEFFLKMRAAVTSSRWDGPAWDEIDQTKTAQRYETERSIGVSTFERYCRQVLGEDWKDVIKQKFRELKFVNEQLEELGQEKISDPIRFIFPEWDNLSRTGGDGRTVTGQTE